MPKFKFKALGFHENLLCKIFGHKNLYFKTMDSPSKHIRFCKRCGDARELKPMNSFEPGRKDYVWMRLVGFTAFGAKEAHKHYEILKD